MPVGEGGEGEGERESQAGSGAEPNVGLDPRILRLCPELKSRVRCSPD